MNVVQGQAKVFQHFDQQPLIDFASQIFHGRPAAPQKDIRVAPLPRSTPSHVNQIKPVGLGVLSELAEEFVAIHGKHRRAFMYERQASNLLGGLTVIQP
ncbi:MAG: hypothetical protein H7833_09370 [Magnetococcus sp. DMHC-1]